MLFSEFNSVSNSISNFVRIGENEFDRCSVNFTNRFPIFSATEEYGLDCHAVSRLAALRRVYGLQRLCPRVLSNQRHSHLFYLLVLFSTPLFYPQVPSMDRCRIRSVLSPDDCSNGPLVHSLRSVRFRIRTFLLNLIFRVSHFRNCQRRKQGAKHRHCSAQKISNLGFFIPTNNQCDKAGGRPEHKFIDRSKLHFFLRVLGLDFCLTAQILPSTPETSFVRMRRWPSRNSSSSFFFPAFAVWQLHLYSCSKTAKGTLCLLPHPD